MTLSQPPRKVLGYYLVWVALHLVLLLIVSDGAFDGRNSNDGVDDFVPLNLITDSYYSDSEEYDITEFLAYTIIPLVALGAFLALRGGDSTPSDSQAATNDMNYTEYLAETPFINEFPHNVVEMHLRDGRVKTLFVDNRRLAPPVAGGPLGSIEEAVRAYMSDHPEVAEAQVYLVQGRGERHYMKTVTSA